MPNPKTHQGGDPNEPEEKVDTTTADDVQVKGLEALIESNAFGERLAELAKKYLLFSKKNVEQDIAKAEIIFQAEEEIGKKYLKDFYAVIGEDPKGSTVKKLRKIGEKSQRFKRHLDRLPNNWTTLYNLAILPEDKYLKLADDGILTPTATWKELSVHCVEAKPEKPKKPRRRIILDIKDVPVGKRSRFVREMEQMCKEFSVSLPEEHRATLNEFIPVFEEGNRDA